MAKTIGKSGEQGKECSFTEEGGGVGRAVIN